MGAGPGLHFTVFMMFGAHAQWAAMPAAETEFLGITCRARVRTEGYTQAMSSCEIIGPGAAGSVLRAKYSLDLSGASAFSPLVGEDMAIDAGGVVVTNWVTLPSAARDRELLMSIVGEGGDAVAGPAIGRVWIGLR